MSETTVKYVLSDVLRSASSIMIGERNVIKVEIPSTLTHLVRLVTLGPSGEMAYLADHTKEVEVTEGKIVVPLTIEGVETEELTEIELFVTRPLLSQDVKRQIVSAPAESALTQ